ncbi:MAG: DUF167 domain-containing protein [Candidatus Lokiarchaeota archaeon]|nr:DUF167 domain-containing protein [Candidatus Lokiarchaeota archaeon]
MDFLEIKANNVYLLRVKVKTNSIKQEILPISETDSWLSIMLKSKPVRNKANKELINLIKKRIEIASDQIHIISGLTKTSKTLEIKFIDNIGRTDLIKRLIG